MLIVRGATQLRSLNEFLQTGPTAKLFCNDGPGVVVGNAEKVVDKEISGSIPSTFHTNLSFY